MANNDNEKLEANASSNVGDSGATKETALAYHAPALTTFGTLAELVQNNPSGGSDGGTGDCQHN
jgi:hypothetical protein